MSAKDVNKRNQPKIPGRELSGFPQMDFIEMQVPKARSYKEETEEGILFVQESVTDDYNFRFSIVKCFAKVDLYLEPQPGVLHCRIALRNNCFCRLGVGAKRKLNPGQFILAVGNRVRCKTFLPSAGEYHVLEISFSEVVLDALKAIFPRLASPEFGDVGKHVHTLTKMARFLPPGTLDIIHILMQCPFESRKKEFFYTNKIIELVFLLLKSTEKDMVRLLSQHEIEIAEKSRALLLKDIRHHMLIPDLAKRLSTNQSTLKEIFKQVFGMSIFQCLLQERMRTAKRILVETEKPIKEIANLVGYESDSSFISAFQQYYSCTPASIRTAKGPDA